MNNEHIIDFSPGRTPRYSIMSLHFYTYANLQRLGFGRVYKTPLHCPPMEGGTC